VKRTFDLLFLIVFVIVMLFFQSVFLIFSADIFSCWGVPYLVDTVAMLAGVFILPVVPPKTG